MTESKSKYTAILVVLEVLRGSVESIANLRVKEACF